MFRLDEGLKVYLHREPVDFHLNINGLAVLVEQALGMDPFASCAYVFSNRRRDRVKSKPSRKHALARGIGIDARRPAYAEPSAMFQGSSAS